MSRRTKGDGTLFQTDDGRWRGYVTLPNGKRKYFSGQTKVEANANRKKLVQQRDTTGIAAGTGYTVDQWIDYWLEMKASDPIHGHAPKTTLSYKDAQRKYLSTEFKRQPLRKVSIEAIEAEYQLLTNRGLAGSTRHQVHALLSASFKSAVLRGHMQNNPATLVENKPRPERPPVESLSLEDLERIEDTLNGTRNEAR